MDSQIKRLGRRDLYEFLSRQQIAVIAFVLDRYSGRRIEQFFTDLKNKGYHRIHDKVSIDQEIDDIKTELNRKDHDPKFWIQIEIINRSIANFKSMRLGIPWKDRKFQTIDEPEVKKEGLKEQLSRRLQVIWKKKDEPLEEQDDDDVSYEDVPF